ncbi:MAG: tetratricopeptide repeat protein [Thiohalophilus sp.]
MMNLINNLEKMLADGQDSLLLRFGLGQAYYKEQQYDNAIVHLQRALQLDGEYSAAWKLLGQSHAENGEREQAIATYEKGIEIAEKKGDMQAAKEMRVFLKRLLK